MSTDEAGAALEASVSRETFERLRFFERELIRWNARINLVASTDNLWDRHIRDCLQLAECAPSKKSWLDLGSGGGLPGIVLAIILLERGGHIDLVESNRKKAAFLQSIVGALDLPAQVHAMRIESAISKVSNVEIVTARALAPLTQLLDLSAFWLTEGARGIFPKGQHFREEVAEASLRWGFDLIEHPSRIEPRGMILEISNLQRLA